MYVRMSQLGSTFSPATTYCAAKYMTMKPTPMSVRPSANLTGAAGSGLRLPKLTHRAANTGENTMMKNGLMFWRTPAGISQPKM